MTEENKKIDIKSSHVFSKVMKYREEADYNPFYMFAREDFMNLTKESEELVGKIKDYLKREGYLILCIKYARLLSLPPPQGLPDS